MAKRKLRGIQFDSPDEVEVFHAKESWVPVVLGCIPILILGIAAFLQPKQVAAKNAAVLPLEFACKLLCVLVEHLLRIVCCRVVVALHKPEHHKHARNRAAHLTHATHAAAKG